MTTIQDMHAAVDAAAQAHFEWCTDHDYENEADPEVQLCRSVFALNLESDDRDDVSAVCIALAGSHTDEAYGFPVPQASIGINGRPADFEMAPWKLTPIAYVLLAAAARAEGDEARARAFMDAAQTAITEHASQTAEPEPEYVVAAPAGHWSQGPFAYVMGSDPEDGIITWDQYQVEQSLAAGVPQYVIQHTTDRRFQVVGALDSKPVSEETYAEFDDAKTVRDRLNEQARSNGPAAEVLTDADELATLPLASRVADCKGVEWRKFSSGWRFRCLGGYNDGSQTSDWLAGYAPLTVLSDDTEYVVAKPTPQPEPVPQFIVQHTKPGHWQVGGIDSRYNGRSVDGHDYTDFAAAKRAATVLNAAKRVFDMAPVPHHYDRTQPHPRAIKDCARNVYGIDDATDDEIRAAVLVVMA